jgi:hypothetical protein
MTSIQVLTILFSMIGLAANGQKITEDCGHSTDPKLNKCELEFFDSFFIDPVFRKKDYDFRDKKFAFLSAGQLVEKDDFFKLISEYRRPKGFHFFNLDQRTKTGYDGIILINLKAYNLDNIAETIKKQKEK